MGKTPTNIDANTMHNTTINTKKVLPAPHNNTSNTPSSQTVVKLKAKSDPEALLNDLSSSLKSFQSTVRLWTQSSTLPASVSNNFDANSNRNGLRPARLGLGAKAQRNVQGDSVAGNLALKKQLTGSANEKPAFIPGNNKYKNSNMTSNKNNHNNYSNKPKKRNDSDDECGGRASLISKKQKK